jgi:hypothetical protein
MNCPRSWGWCVLLSATTLAGAPSVEAQSRSPVQDLLANARIAFNNLKYREADSIASGVLTLSPLRRAERVQALQIRAGALYPEEEGAQQRPEALAVLRELVRIAPGAALPREVTWPGLEALLREAKQSTFGVSVSPQGQVFITGPDELADLPVQASRPAAIYLWLAPVSGPTTMLDSARSATNSRLRFQVLRNGVPRYPTGDYRLVLVAVDESAPDTMRIELDANIIAPPLEFLPVPERLDSGFIRPEKTRPKRSAGIIGGIAALAGTIVASRVLRDSELRNAAGADSRAISVGIVLGVGVAGGVWALDKGQPIPENIAANKQTRAEFEKTVSEARAENARRLRSYRAEININPEPKS